MGSSPPLHLHSVVFFFLIQPLLILFNTFLVLLDLQECISICFQKLTGSSLGNSVVTLDIKRPAEDHKLEPDCSTEDPT